MLALAAASAVAAVVAPPAAAAPGTPAGVPTISTAAPAPAPTPSPLPPEAPVATTITPLALAAGARDAEGTREAKSTTPLKLVAITWTGPAPDTVQIRTTDASGRPGAWTTLDASATERDDQPAGSTGTGGTDPVWVGDRTDVEVRATRAGQPATADLKIVRIDPGTSPNDALVATTGRAASMPTYVTRAQWGADPALLTWKPEVLPETKAVTIHHTDGANDYSQADSAGIVRAIYAYHSKTQGWGDIGYNALVDRFGTIFEGRAGGLANAVVAAHAGGFNRYTFGIAMMGNHLSTAPSAATLESVSRLAAWKLAGHDPNERIQLTSTGGGTSKYAKGQVATVPRLFGHRDVGNTQCPGGAGYAALPTIRARVTALAASGSSSPTTTPATTTPATTVNPVTAAPTTTRTPSTTTGGATTTTPSTSKPSTTTPSTTTSAGAAAAAITPDLRFLWGPGEPYLQAGLTTGGRGRFNIYPWGSVYWTPTTGGWEIYGGIRASWLSKGAETSTLGYPTSNEYDVSGGRQQNFEHGVLRWLSANGAVFTPTS